MLFGVGELVAVFFHNASKLALRGLCYPLGDDAVWLPIDLVVEPTRLVGLYGGQLCIYDLLDYLFWVWLLGRGLCRVWLLRILRGRGHRGAKRESQKQGR